MISLTVGMAVKVEGDKEDNTYVVRGHDPVSSRWWLAVNDQEYDGYNGDLIISPEGDEKMWVTLCDERCNLRGRGPITLRAAE